MQMEVDRPGDAIEVRLVGKGAIEEDTQTLSLEGGGNQETVNGEREIVTFERAFVVLVRINSVLSLFNLNKCK